MPTLQFKGKSFVQNHHLAVKFHQLVGVKSKSLTDKVSLHDNLIVQGDNLKALKALLPTYAGKVKCIYIDPPYNTGNEKWVYNDNVNSPMMQEWLGSVVDKEDLTRHDKWLCMMMPRLKLLKELLREDGIIFVSIDDNEIHRLRLLMDEIFGDQNFLQEIIWKNKYGPGAMTKGYGNVHEYVLCYGKNPIESISAPLTEEEIKNYKLKDDKFETRGGYITQPLMTRSKDDRVNLVYPVKHKGKEIWPDKQWIWEETRLKKAIANDEVVFNQDPDTKKWSVRFKQYLYDENGVMRRGKPISLSIGPFNQEGSWEIEGLFGDKDTFNNPKPSALVEKLINITTNGDDGKDAIYLDSYAGSGTTAHAVLRLNKQDGGNRRFILVQIEEELPKDSPAAKAGYSHVYDVTAERVRRVIKGVPKSKNFQEGTGGSFSYFKLGPPIEMEHILHGDRLPTYEELARYVYYTATGEEFNAEDISGDPKKPFIGTSKHYPGGVYLYYEPDMGYLMNRAFTLDMARALGKHNNKRRLVFAPMKYLDQDYLDEMRIDYSQLPFEIYKFKE